MQISNCSAYWGSELYYTAGKIFPYLSGAFGSISLSSPLSSFGHRTSRAINGIDNEQQVGSQVINADFS